MTKFILLLLILCSNLFALDLDSRRNQIIEIIDEELDEVSRLSRQSRSADNLLRMAELNLEKARLWREKENEEYLALSSAKRRSVNKNRYFQKSNRFFNEATKLCLAITRRYKNYRNIADVYYILGFNAKEANQTKKATRYFNLANRKSPKNSKANIRSKISLAELYYNQSKFKSAAYLYERALRAHVDKWWTKDSFNLAWSYYRIGKKSQAIEKMKEIHQKSKSSKFVDMRGQVERDIGVMFATSGRVNEGIAFYKKLDIDFAPMLIGIATTLKKDGKLVDATRVLNEALKYSKSQTLSEQIYIEQLELYAQFNRYRKHLAICRKLYKMRKEIATSTLDKLIFHSKKQGALLQKHVTSKTYRRLPKQRRSKANMAVVYFSIVASLSPNDKEEYLYLEAETARAVGNDLYALKKYEDTYVQKSSKFNARAMDGMLNVLNSKRISSKIKDEWYPKVYETFIRDFAADKRTKLIYQKLFRVYLDQNNYAKAKSVLDRYAKAYRRDYKTQEAMIGNLIEIDRKKKDYNAIKVWVAGVTAKKYFVSNKYETKLKELLTSVQIDGVQAELEKGNKKVALAGYLNVLNDAFATPKAKVNAKYNIAALYFELRDVDQSFKWSNVAISEMTPKQTAQFSSSFLTISKFYFTRLEFDKSIALSQTLLNKTCRVKNSTKNIAFKNAAFLSLANGDVDTAESLVNKAKTCGVYSSYISEVQFELLKSYKEKKLWRNFENTIDDLARKASNRGELISNIDDLEQIHRNLGNTNSVRSLYAKKISFYKQARAKKYDMSAEDLDVIANIENNELESLAKSVVDINLTFPEKIFNANMQRKLSLLDKVTSKAISIQKIGSGAGIVKSYDTLIKTYESVIKDVTSFTPPGKSEGYVKSFKNSMSQLAGPLTNTLDSYKRNGVDSIYKNEILSAQTKEVLASLMKYPTQFIDNQNGVLMDRGGDQ